MRQRSILAALLLMMAGLQTSWAQIMSVNLANGKTVVYGTQEVESVTFSDNVS